MIMETVWLYIKFFIAVYCLVLLTWNLVFFFISIFYCTTTLNNKQNKPDSSSISAKQNGSVKYSPLLDSSRGVSILKPLMGMDAVMKENLETHFRLDYNKFELLLCVPSEDDTAIPMVRSLQELYPHVDCTLFIGGKTGILNPMVYNMAPGYEKAKYDYVWVSTSRIRASSSIIHNLVLRAEDPDVAIVHQLPFVADQEGFVNAVEKISFGSSMAKNYVGLNVLGLCCLTGMSYLVKKPELDHLGGLAYFGKYLAEDFFLGRSLHEKGFRFSMCTIPAQQMVQTTLWGYKDRMVRWLRLRLSMLHVVTLFMEIFTECLPMSLFFTWSTYYLFGWTHHLACFFAVVVIWFTLDTLLLRAIEGGRLNASLGKHVLAWIVRELLVFWVYIEALSNPCRVPWGKRVYRITLGGHTSLSTERSFCCF